MGVRVRVSTMPPEMATAPGKIVSKYVSQLVAK